MSILIVKAESCVHKYILFDANHALWINYSSNKAVEMNRISVCVGNIDIIAKVLSTDNPTC